MIFCTVPPSTAGRCFSFTAALTEAGKPLPG